MAPPRPTWRRFDGEAAEEDAPSRAESGDANRHHRLDQPLPEKRRRRRRLVQKRRGLRRIYCEDGYVRCDVHFGPVVQFWFFYNVISSQLTFFGFSLIFLQYIFPLLRPVIDY